MTIFNALEPFGEPHHTVNHRAKHRLLRLLGLGLLTTSILVVPLAGCKGKDDKAAASGGSEKKVADQADKTSAGGAAANRKDGRGGAGQVPAVDVAKVSQRDLSDTLELTGTLEAARKVEVAPRIAGSLVEVTVDLGDTVKAGQLLARLSDREARERTAQAEASLASTRATATQRAVDLRQAELALKRERELFRGEFTARQDLEAAQARYDSARALSRLAAAEVTRTKAAARESAAALSRARLTAPMAGVVGARHLDPGAIVSAGSPIVTLIADGPLKTLVAVSDSALPRLRMGSTASIRVDAWPDAVFPAKVVRVAPVVDPATRTGQVELSVTDALQRLRPGMFARVALVMATRKAVPAVPREALVRRNGGEGVFKLADDVAQFLPVKTGLTANDWVELLPNPESPAIGTVVVTEGSHLVRDGSQVRLAGAKDKQGADKSGAQQETSDGGNAAAATP